LRARLWLPAHRQANAPKSYAIPRAAGCSNRICVFFLIANFNIAHATTSKRRTYAKMSSPNE
jgi:hypothetical protein